MRHPLPILYGSKMCQYLIGKRGPSPFWPLAVVLVCNCKCRHLCETSPEVRMIRKGSLGERLAPNMSWSQPHEGYSYISQYLTRPAYSITFRRPILYNKILSIWASYKGRHNSPSSRNASTAVSYRTPVPGSYGRSSKTTNARVRE